jgi:hypothetical protein
MSGGRGLSVIVGTLVSLFLLVLFAPSTLPLSSGTRQHQQRSRNIIPSTSGNDRLCVGAARQRSIHHHRLGFVPKSLSDFFDTDDKGGWQVNAQESQQSNSIEKYRQMSDLERAKDFVSSVMKDPVPIEGSEGMSVLHNVMSLQYGETSDLVIRSCDESFWKACIKTAETPNRRYRVCAIGTPGIGKTKSTAILIRILLQMGHTVVYLVRTTQEVGHYYEFTPSTTNVFDERDRGEDITSLTKTSTYYVVDPGPTFDDCCPDDTFQAKSILVSSPDERHWGKSQFTNLRGRVFGVFKYYPLWSLQELLEARPVLNLALTIDEVKNRYRQFGGVPCDVFSDRDDNWPEKLQNTGVYRLTLTDGAALKLVSGEIDFVETGKTDTRKNAVMGYRLAQDDNGLFEEKEVIVISDLVAEKISTKFIKSLWSKMNDKDINGPTIFAAYTRLLMTKKEAIPLRCRANVGEKNVEYKSHPTKLLGGCTGIRLVLDLVEAVAAAKAENGSKILLCPANKLNPLIDFLYKDEEQHFHVFHVTLRRRHDAKVPDIKQLENAVGDASKLSIYYAVPSEHFGTFVTDPVDPKEAGALCDIFHVMIPNPNDTADAGPD